LPQPDAVRRPCWPSWVFMFFLPFCLPNFPM
jgi:hypothetical protein